MTDKVENMDESPPPGLSAVQLRAWKRKQKILRNGNNRMKLVTGQTSVLEREETSSKETEAASPPDNSAQSSTPTGNSASGSESSPVKNGKATGVAEMAESSSANEEKAKESEVNSAKQSNSEEQPKEESGVDEEKPVERKPTWETKWAKARSKKGLMTEEAVEKLLSQKPEAVQDQEQTASAEHHKGNELKQRHGVKEGHSMNAKGDGTIPAQAKGLTADRVELLKNTVMVFRRLLLLVVSAYAGFTWIVYEYPAASCDHTPGEEPVLHDQLVWSYSNSLPVPLVWDSLLMTLIALQISLTMLLAGSVFLANGSISALFPNPPPGSMMAMALPMIAATMGPNAFKMFTAGKEFLRIPAVALEDATFCLVGFFLTAAVVNQFW